MSSLRNHEGYLLLDHRNSPGFSDAVARKADLPVGAGRGVFEAPTYTCKHCQRIVVIEPKRTRERAYCRGCDHFICDPCGAERAGTGLCRTFDQVIDEMLNKAAQAAGD